MVLKRLRRALLRLDLRVRAALDRVLPRNLTSRYLFGLGAVAALALAGQALVQLSLTRHLEGQERLRVLDAQLNLSEHLRRAVLTLNLASSGAEKRRQCAVIRELAGRLGDGFGESAKLAELRSRVALGADFLQKMLAGPARFAVSGAARKLTSDIEAYQSEGRALTQMLELRLRRFLGGIQRLELALLGLTLLVLALEALYVFRPAVERLYDALYVRSDFLSRMSHEIRNPMNSIIGMANLLSETQLGDQQKKYVSILRKASRGLLDMLNNLLDFSSIESGNVEIENIPFNLYEVLERTLDMAVVGAHANGIELVLDLAHDVPLTITGDPLRLQQILSNLLGNAVKFTPQGACVLRVEREDAATLRFSVVDTGIGIEADKLERIFEPFIQEDSTVKRRFGGTGLGLSIASQLVQRLGGRLTVESRKGVGSRFSFTLPAVVADGQPSVARSIARKELAPFEAIVVVSDPRLAEVLEKLVAACGGKARRLEPGPELWQEVARQCVALVDYDLVGAELAARPDLAARLVVVLKTTAPPQAIESLGRQGFENLLFKPVKPLQLLDAIATALSGRPVETATPAAAPAPLDSRELRLLIADDSHDNQLLIAAYLEALPYRLTAVDDGREALKLFKEGRFDIVLMDLQMPELDGYSAARQMREWERERKLPRTPIVAISAHGEDVGGEPRFMRAGFSARLVKPIGPVRLRNLIWELTGDPVLRAQRQIARLAPGYLEHRKAELVQLQKYAEARDFPALQDVGHRLKGNAETYGFAPLARIGAALEQAARARDLARARQLVEEIRAFVSASEPKRDGGVVG